MTEFLALLFEYMGSRRLSTLSICRLFNPSDRSDQRQRLREAWQALNVGEPTLNSVEQVLKSSHCTIVRTWMGPSTIRRVPLAYHARKTAWMFGPAGTGQEAFLRALRERFAGRELRLGEAYALLQEDAALDDLATTAGKRTLHPLSRSQFLALLVYCQMVRVDGFVLVCRNGGRWLFVRTE